MDVRGAHGTGGRGAGRRHPGPGWDFAVHDGALGCDRWAGPAGSRQALPHQGINMSRGMTWMPVEQLEVPTRTGPGGQLAERKPSLCWNIIHDWITGNPDRGRRTFSLAAHQPQVGWAPHVAHLAVWHHDGAQVQENNSLREAHRCQCSVRLGVFNHDAGR